MPYGACLVHVCDNCKMLKRRDQSCGVCGTPMVIEDIISEKQYFNGRDVEFASELTQELRDNAKRLLAKVNELLTTLKWDKPIVVTSGWRPAAINATTPGAAKHSKHMVCLAVDIADIDGKLNAMCAANEPLMRRLNLAIENRQATPTWCHIQLGLPASGRVVFLP